VIRIRRKLKRNASKTVRHNILRTNEREEKFDDQAERIFTGYKNRRGVKGRPPYDTAEGYIRREAYAFLEREIAGGGRTIKTLIRKFGLQPRYPSYKENPFYWGLLALDPTLENLTRHKVSLYARQLLYAHRNAIPANYLIGFIFQSGINRDLPLTGDAQKRDPSLFTGC
jgi:hypothetical protein